MSKPPISTGYLIRINRDEGRFTGSFTIIFAFFYIQVFLFFLSFDIISFVIRSDYRPFASTDTSARLDHPWRDGHFVFRSTDTVFTNPLLPRRPRSLPLTPSDFSTPTTSHIIFFSGNGVWYLISIEFYLICGF